MQNCTTILGIIDMRQRGISYNDCRSRYKVGCNTITLIMDRFKESGKDLDTLKQMPKRTLKTSSSAPEDENNTEDNETECRLTVYYNEPDIDIGNMSADGGIGYMGFLILWFPEKSCF